MSRNIKLTGPESMHTNIYKFKWHYTAPAGTVNALTKLVLYT